MKLHGHRDAAKHLATGLIERGVDMAYAYKPLHSIRLAHAFTNTFLYLDWDRHGFPYPVVPFAINCYGSNLIHAKGGIGRAVHAAARPTASRRPALAAAVALHGCRRARSPSLGANRRGGSR